MHDFFHKHYANMYTFVDNHHKVQKFLENSHPKKTRNMGNWKFLYF